MNRNQITEKNYVPANEVPEGWDKRDNAASPAEKDHGGVADQDWDEEMEIGGESKGEVGKDSTWGGGVNVIGRWSAWNEAPEETSRNGGGETEEESEDWDRHPDRRRHWLHLHLHCCSFLSLDMWVKNPRSWVFDPCS